MVNVDVHVTKRRPLKGAVLFTVLVVMVVMLILMITTIGLASNASRRAYSEYFDHQTHSTARSVVESSIEHLRTNVDLGTAIINNVDNVGEVVDVQVNGGNDLGEGFGTVDHLFFENIGTDSASSFNITGSGKPIIKVTAVVTQGGVTSTYSQYCIGDVESDDDASSGGGLVALGGFEGTAQPGVDAHSPAYFGVSDSFSYDELVTLSNPNAGQLNSLIVNSSARTKTQVKVSLGRKEGLTIMGNLFCDDGTTQVYNESYTMTDYKNDLGGSTKPTDNAYVYVGGCLDLTQPFVAAKGNDADSADYNQAPINIYCGRIVLRNSAAILGNMDIYCYNQGSDAPMWDDGTDHEAFAKNPWSRIGTARVSKLLSWAEELHDTSNRKSVVDTGSLMTMGNLQLTEKVQIAGDLFVNGELNVTGLTTGGADGSKINGNVYVAGSLTGDVDKLDEICEGVIYNGTAAGDHSQPYNSSALPAKVSSFISGDLALSNVKTKVVKTADQVYNEFYENKKDDHGIEITPVVKTVKNSVNKSKLVANGTTMVYREVGGNIVGEDLDHIKDNATGTTVTATTGTVPGISASDGGSYGAEISGNCILAGQFNKNIYINPTGTIWIDCFDLQLRNGASIIINDRNGKVNFFFPSDKAGLSDSNVATGYEEAYRSLFKDYTHSVTVDTWWPVESHVTTTTTYNNRLVTAGSGNFIRTVEYAKKFTPGTASPINLVRYPTDDSDTDNDWMLPQVGLYAREGGKVLVYFENPIFVTGDIFMPGADFYALSQCKMQGMNMNYNGHKVESNNAAFIGSIIVDTIKEYNNDMTMIYVDDPPGGSGHIPGDDIYQWQPIDGYADY